MDSTKLDAVLQEIIARWEIPGMAVGIVEENEIAFARCYGAQSLDTGVPVSTDSVFCVESITKCFVATAVMQLAERGTVDLDSPITRYLPYFKLDDERYQQITLRQVLSHTSGMPDMDEIEYGELVSHPETDEGAAERYVRALSSRKLIAKPGERFSYSNIAYNVLGDLITKVSGQTFEAYMKEHILLPAAMPGSTLLLADVDKSRLAVPHLRVPEMIVNPIYPYHRADAPASFLHTTVLDMCQWMITSLGQGRHAGRSLADPGSYELMWTPVVSRGYPPLYESAGLGWTLGHIDGMKTVCHGGSGFGATSFLVLLPEKNRGAIILCNEESSAHNQVTDVVIETMLDREPAAGPVSWLVPVCRALQSGGIEAAYDLYAEIKDDPGYLVDGYELEFLVYQLIGVQKIGLAIDVLKLNLFAFPGHLPSLVLLAKLLIKQQDYAQARLHLQAAHLAAPNSITVSRLLAEVQETEAHLQS